MSLRYDTFSAIPCELSDVLQFAAEVNKKFPGTELAIDLPFAGKLVLPIAPSVGCYRKETDNYRVEVYGAHSSNDLMRAVDWNLPQYQSLRHFFGFDVGPLESMTLGISHVGLGVDPPFKSRAWLPNIGVSLSTELVDPAGRAERFAELIALAGLVPPKVFVDDGTTFLKLPDDAPYSLEGLRPDLDTASAVAAPTSMNLIVEDGAEPVLSLAEKLVCGFDPGDPVVSTLAFNSKDAEQYVEMKNRFSQAMGQTNVVWNVKPKVPMLSEVARQALAGEGDAEGLDVLPLLEICDKKEMHPVSVFRQGKLWQLVVGTYLPERKQELKDKLTPFVNGWRDDIPSTD